MTPTPWFGLYLPQMRMNVGTILERCVRAQDSGWDSVWLMDHLSAPLVPDADTFEAWTLAATVAARTETLRIGHMTNCDAFRHPALLAKMAATLDVASDGRLELGLGWGSVPEELVRFGFEAPPPRERAARLRETLDILGLMFAGEEFDYDGDFFRLNGAIGRPVPVQDPIPVHIGGGGAGLTMPLVASHAQWWNCPGYALERFDELAPMRGAARVSIQRPIGLATASSDRDEVAELVGRRFQGWGGVATGTPDEVAATLVADVERGVEGFVIQLHDFGRPETIETFATKVIPVVRAAAGTTEVRA